MFAPPPATQVNVPLPAADDHGAAALSVVKRLIWLYFWLLIFEGALRKWVLPGWSNPLLLVRDPVVILIYIFAAVAGVFPRNGYVVTTMVLGFLSVIVSEIFGRGNLLVTLYGFRTSFLHLPLIFLIPNVFDARDMNRLAKWLLITSIPMCFIVLAQFRADPGDWLNNGTGGVAGAQLEVGFGKIRPPGLFSFAAVLVSYLSVVAGFAFYPQMTRAAANNRLATAAMPALAIMVAVSGSRAALGAMALVLVAVVAACARKPAFFGRGMKVVVLVGAAYFALSFWSEFRQGLEIHQERITEGGGLREGIFLRALGDLLEPFRAIIDAPFFGVGLGMGTNGASGFLYGRVVFNLGEGDWGRIVRESGPILGFAYIGLRVGILVHLARAARDSLMRDNPLPLLLFAAIFPQILNGQFGVPSILGFAVFNAGLCLAATSLEGASVPAPAKAAAAAPVAARNFRGRSIYADELHGEIEDPDIARYGP